MEAINSINSIIFHEEIFQVFHFFSLGNSVKILKKCEIVNYDWNSIKFAAISKQTQWTVPQLAAKYLKPLKMLNLPSIARHSKMLIFAWFYAVQQVVRLCLEISGNFVIFSSAILFIVQICLRIGERMLKCLTFSHIFHVLFLL